MNREIYPGGLYPLSGDVLSQPGSPDTSVVGIQGVPIDTVTFNGGEVLEFNVTTGTWTPTLRASIQVNYITVSDDSIISVNVVKLPLINGA